MFPCLPEVTNGMTDTGENKVTFKNFRHICGTFGIGLKGRKDTL